MSSSIAIASGEALAFEQIEAAVKETSRGRWFLEEYARRHRHSDTLAVVGAIESLARKISQRPATGASDQMHADIMEMARAIARTERDIRVMRASDGAERSISASDELDAVVATTEKATGAILSAAERIQEHAWTIRENNGDEAQCNLLDACATDIYSACAFQDMTAQRIRKVVGTLRYVDQRIKGILDAAGLSVEIDAELEAEGDASVDETGHSPADIWMSEAHQHEIDETFEFFVPAETSEPTMVGAELMDIEGELLLPSPPPVKTSGTAVRKKQTSPRLIKAIPDAHAEIEADPLPKSRPKTSAALASYDEQPLEIRLRAFR